MRTLTHEQWTAEAVRRFGPDPMRWAFVCPACKHVATVKDWKDAGASEGAVAFSCIGRWQARARDAFATTGAGPCNYAGGGLFGLNPVRVTHDGKEHDVFEFAEGVAVTARIIVAEAHAFYQNDKPDGFGRGLAFADDAEGFTYCRELERWYTLRGHLYQIERMLRTAKLLAARPERTDEEQKSIISCVYWLMRRGAIPCDEFNGTMFHCFVVRDGEPRDLLMSEENPATLDLDNLGPGAVDVTDIARASPFLPGDKGALAALRVAADHARKKR